MDGTDNDLVERWATCLTENCGNQGASIHILTPDGGDVQCGVCGNPITDITDIKPDEGQVLPEWISEMLKQQNSDD